MVLLQIEKVISSSISRSSTDRYANIDVGVLLYHIERFSGIVILTTNIIENIDMAFFRRLRFILQLDIPARALRVKLWKVSVGFFKGKNIEARRYFLFLP